MIKSRILKVIKNRTKTVQKIVEDKVTTKQQLQEVLSHGSPKERGLFIMPMSSSACISELLQLTPNDIDFSSNRD